MYGKKGESLLYLKQAKKKEGTNEREKMPGALIEKAIGLLETPPPMQCHQDEDDEEWVESISK